MESANDEILTIKAAHGLLRLKYAPPPAPAIKKQRKTLVKEIRAQNLKEWHRMRRTVKKREATKRLNRSNAMKKAWAKRKMDTII